MSTAVTTKLVALGAAGSMVANTALPYVKEGLNKASGAAARKLEALASAIGETKEAAADVVGEVATGGGPNRAALYFAIGLATPVVAYTGYWVGGKAWRWMFPQKKVNWTVGGKVEECVVQGSTEHSMLEPRFSCRIGYTNSQGDNIMVGWGTRIDYAQGSYLVTAQHCLNLDKPMWMRKGKECIPLDLKEAAPIANDLAVIPVPTKFFVQLSMTKARFGLVPPRGVTASVMGLEGKGTTGTVEPLYKTQNGYFGWVRYLGSTMRGYSGSPYFSGNMVYGIHTTGGMFNGGINAMYLHVLAKIHLDAGLEEESPHKLRRWLDDPDMDDDNMPVTYETNEKNEKWVVVSNRKTGEYSRMREEDYTRVYDEWMDKVVEDRERLEDEAERKREEFEERQEREAERREWDREYESGAVLVPPTPPPAQAMQISIPMAAPAPQPQPQQTSAVQGNGPTPGTSRGGDGSHPNEVSRSANPPNQTAEPSLRSQLLQKRQELNELTSKVVSIKRQLGIPAKLKPRSRSTQQSAQQQLPAINNPRSARGQ